MADMGKALPANGGPIERLGWTPPRTSWPAWFGGVLMLAFGTVSLVAGAAGRDPLVLGVGLFFLGVGAPVFVNLLLSRRAGPAIVVARHGSEAVTVLTAHPPARRWVATVMVLTTALALLAVGVHLGIGDGWGVASPFVLVGAYLLAGTPYYAAGRFGTGDIRLDRQGVGQHLEGRDQWIAWEDLQEVIPHPDGQPLVLLGGREGATVRRRSTVPAPFRWRHRWPEAPVVVLSLQRVSVHPVMVAWALELYRSRPSWRARLGTQQSVDDIRGFLEEHVIDP